MKELLKDYVSGYDVIDMLGVFEDKYLFEEKEMYTNGEFLHAEVDYNNPIVKKELDNLIIDVEKYRIENNEMFTHGEEANMIGLSLLVEIVRKEMQQEIMYNADKMYFYIEGEYDEEDEARDGLYED